MKTIQLILFSTFPFMIFGCNKNKSFYDLIESKGIIQIINKEISNFEFGDCFLHVDEESNYYLLIVISDNNDDFVSFATTNLVDSINSESDMLNDINITYYSRKPQFSDYIFGSEIPYGCFKLFFMRNDKVELNYLQMKIRYLFTLNLDRAKIKEYGGTSIILTNSLKQNIERCLSFGNRASSLGESLSVHIPLKNLCM